MENYYIIISIALIAVLIGVIFWRLKDKQIGFQANKNTTESSSIQPSTKTENKQRQSILIGIGILVVLLGLFFYMYETKNNPGSLSDDSNSWVAMLPIWIAIWIPFMSKKKKEESTAKQKKILLVVVGLTLLAVLGTIAFWLFNSN